MEFLRFLADNPTITLVLSAVTTCFLVIADRVARSFQTGYTEKAKFEAQKARDELELERLRRSSKEVTHPQPIEEEVVISIDPDRGYRGTRG